MGFLKGLFGSKPTGPTISHGDLRAQKNEARLESMRKGAINARESAIRGPVQVSSSRDFINKSLGKPSGPTQGTSLGRMGQNNGSIRSMGSASMPSLPPKLPPMRPLGR